MEVLIFILIMVFIFANKNKGKNAGTAAKRTPAARQATNTLSRAQARFDEMLAELEKDTADDIEIVSKSGQRRAAPVKVASQKSPVFMATPKTAKAPQTPSAAKVSRAATAPQAAQAAKAPGLLDEEGCVGGSMAHTHEEGESREEHRRHMESVLTREAEEGLAAQAALELSEMNLHRLRQAVVMAEILDRPKALRRRA